MEPEKVSNDFDWEVIFAHLESRLSSMRTWRYSWWTYWSKLAEYILPRRYHWLVTANLMRRGNAINQAIIDGTAGLAKNICYTGMVDGLCPTTREWFKRTVAQQNFEIDATGKEYLEECDRRAYLVLAESNFYEEIAQVAEDEVVFGTAPLIVYEDVENVCWFSNPCAGEYYLSVGGHNTVDTLYTEQTKTVEQLVDFFTLDACPEQVRELWESGGGSLQNEFVQCMAIEPNFALSGRGQSKGKKVEVVRGGFPYREVYWLRGVKTQRPLSVRGFHKKPFSAFRWAKTSNDPYGRSPGMDGLGDVIQLQIMTRRLNEGIEKQVRPPMGADPALKNEPASINPGHITYTDTSNGKKGFWSLFDVRIDLSGMEKTLTSVCNRIDRYFMVDVFMAITRMEGVQPRNNMEIAARKAEAMQRLGPVIGLWKTEIRGVLERVYDIMDRRGLFPPMPKSLHGVQLKYNFLDMVTLAQLGAETASMEEGFRVGGELSEAAIQAKVPNPLRIMNLDESYRIYLDHMNFPAKGLFTAREVAKHDTARQQAQNPAQIAALAPATLPAVQAAESLSKIPAGGGNSMLGQMLGGGGGGGGGPDLSAGA
jgi:hypothetical protein